MSDRDWSSDVCSSDLQREAMRGQQAGRPHFLDGCHSWASDGEVVATLYPQFFTPKKL